MPIATLLLREESGPSLKALVERAQQGRSPLLEYDLQLNNCCLELTLTSKPQVFAKPPQPDEGFESDVDTVSIVSSENSFTLANGQENGSKPQTETDSANGSASSDSEQENHLVKSSLDTPVDDGNSESLHSCLSARNLGIDDATLISSASRNLGFNPSSLLRTASPNLDARNVSASCKADSTRIVIESPNIGSASRELGLESRNKSANINLEQSPSGAKHLSKIQPSRSSISGRNEEPSQSCKETYHLVDCLCYTDVKFPNVLVFVIKNETLVFRFENLRHLQSLYANFSMLKAVTNQKTYNSKLIGTKFNLLQRTDNNGITHIEITREKRANSYLHNNSSGPSSIISLNTPEDCLDRLINGETDPRSLTSLPFSEDYKESRVRDSNQSHRSESNFIDDTAASVNNKRASHNVCIEKSASSDNLLDINENKALVNQNNKDKLVKNWNSVENLLDAPKRPDRRRRVKYKAPQPPVVPSTNNDDNTKDVLSGQFVRVNVNFEPKETHKQLIIKSHLKEPHPKKLQNFNILSTKPTLGGFLSSKPKLKTYQEFKYSEPKRVVESATLQRIRYKPESNWTNSVPRLLKKPRSKSETRNFTPMAYRYIDTTQNGTISYGVAQASHKVVSNIFGGNSNPGAQEQRNHLSNAHTISNRLFGLSPKLKEFGSSDLKRDRWGSLSDICFKGDNNLKSVIKKDEGKKKNEKKVTFSAYTTVQVV